MTSKRPSFTDQEALDFHSKPTAGKISMAPTKPMGTQRDLSLAYSPGVAVPVLAIAEDEDKAYDYTSKGNMVAVISNGTAILGLHRRPFSAVPYAEQSEAGGNDRAPACPGTASRSTSPSPPSSRSAGTARRAPPSATWQE